MATASFLGRHGNTYIYVPNLIGYARVVFALFAFAVAMRNPYWCISSYFIGFVLDETDGRAARFLDQTSTLGKVLDMVTDRLATAGLLAVLGMLYPRSYMVFLALMFLDIFSHWFQMYSTFISGSETHKDINSQSWMVRMYYKHRLFMGACCISCEVLYLSLYAVDWRQFREWPTLPLPHFAEPYRRYAALRHGIPVAAVTAMLSLPGFVVKQVVNVFQLKASMQALVAYDKRRDTENNDRRQHVD